MSINTRERPFIATGADSGLKVPLIVEGDAGAAVQPLALGVPLPRGALRDVDALSLRDADGRQMPLQATALARWSDGSVRWALVESIARQSGNWSLELSETPLDRPTTALRLNESENSLVIDTGRVTFHLCDTAVPPLARVVVDGSDAILRGSPRTVLRNAKGREAALQIERIVVEARGPVRATVRAEGTFRGAVECRCLARCSFFAHSGLVKLDLTIHNANRARHPGGLWDLGDRGSIFFRDLTFSLAIPSAQDTSVTWLAEPRQSPQRTPGSLAIYQDSSGGENWRSGNHVNRQGRIPCTFRGYRLRANGAEISGLRAEPVVTITNAAASVTVAVPEFWQQFPKAIEASDGSVRIGLFPTEWQDSFELQAGEQKTHTVWLHFGPAASPSGGALNWVHDPMTARTSPQWNAKSGAIPWLSPSRDATDKPLATMLRAAVCGEDSLFARREIIDEYGWRNFGDAYADHEAAHFTGPPPIVSHYNNQYDMVYGAAVQYLCTGHPAWRQLLDAMARHAIDIDIYHTTGDRAAYSGGMFWHTHHYHDAATCTHRSFSRAHKRPRVRCGGGPCNEHVYTTGLTYCYYLTGNPQARDAVLGLADWVIRCDDGSRTILGILDDGPTGLASATRHPDFHGPGRGAGNSVNALLDAWLVSEKPQHLLKAEELIRRVVHPNDDVASRNLLNVEERWSYTVFLTALARYLDAKAEAGQLDSMYAYAQASLLRYAQWMLHFERPYLDHPNQLEYPTETWPAHDFRKANVLRFAACHAGGTLRSELLARADALADRAAADLLKFGKPDTTRALSILMIERARDAFFRERAPDPAPDVATDERSWGPPEAFVTQRRRVLAQLTQPRAFARSLIRLANPKRWHRYLTSRTCH